MQVVVAIVYREHASRILGVAQCPIKIDYSVKGASLPDPLVECKTRARSGVQAPGRKVSFSNPVSVAPKILMPRVWACTTSCFRPAII